MKIIRPAFAALVILGAGAPAPAAASEPDSVTYTCLMAQENLEALATPVDLPVDLRLDLPRDVAPGDQLNLRGSLSVTVPEPASRAIALGSSDLQVRTAMLPLRATAGQDSTRLPATWTSGSVPTSTGALTTSGPIGLPAYTVPDTEVVELALPDTNDQSPVLGDVKVAFNLEATGTGRLGGTTTYLFSCTATEGTDTTVALLGVDAAPTSTTPMPPAEEQPAPTSRPPGAAPPALPPPLPVEFARTTPPVAKPGPEAAPAPERVAFDWGAPTSGPARDGVLIAPSTLGGITLAILVAALAHAAWSERRLRLLKRRRPG